MPLNIDGPGRSRTRVLSGPVLVVITLNVVVEALGIAGWVFNRVDLTGGGPIGTASGLSGASQIPPGLPNPPRTLPGGLPPSQKPERGFCRRAFAATCKRPAFRTWASKGPPTKARRFQGATSHQHQKVARPPPDLFSLSEPSTYTNEKVLLLTKMDLTEFKP